MSIIVGLFLRITPVLHGRESTANVNTRVWDRSYTSSIITDKIPRSKFSRSDSSASSIAVLIAAAWRTNLR
jgi:hypothetical protein